MRVIITLLLIMITAGVAASPHTGAVTCPSSGNKVVITTSAKTASYTVSAPIFPTPNTGAICIGAANVTTSNGLCLGPGQAYTVPAQGNSAPYDLANVYFACTITADILQYAYQ